MYVRGSLFSSPGPFVHLYQLSCSHSFIISLEVENVSPLALFFFFKVVLAPPGPLYFFMNFRTSLSMYTKKGCWDFHQDCTKSVDKLRKN